MFIFSGGNLINYLEINPKNIKHHGWMSSKINLQAFTYSVKLRRNNDLLIKKFYFVSVGWIDKVLNQSLCPFLR